MGFGHFVSVGLSAALLAYLGLWLLPKPAQSELTEDADSTGETPLPSALWMGPTLSGGGYSSEAIAYAVELANHYREGPSDFGLRQFAEHQNSEFMQGLPQANMQVLQNLVMAGAGRPRGKKRWDVAICHATPDVWHADGAFGWGRVQPCPPRDARFTVGRTMYETDRLPEKWVARINAMDEVWVPSAFAVGQFVSSGVNESKIVVVPEAVDTALFDPAMHEPLELGDAKRKGKGQTKDKIISAGVNGSRPFTFLSVFKWEKRKGWDVLLRAYFEEFSADDAVELVVKTSAFHSDSNFVDKVNAFAAGLSAARKPLAHYRVLDSNLPLRDLPRLYRTADAFVLPSRGEGWGRPHVEAMSMALPVIATNWSGSTEFLAEHCSLPLRIEGLRQVDDGLIGHRWAEPSVTHLRSLMRWVVENPAEAKLIGERARKEMLAHFSPEVVVQRHVLPQLKRIKQHLLQKSRRRRKSGGEL